MNQIPTSLGIYLRKKMYQHIKIDIRSLIKLIQFINLISYTVNLSDISASKPQIDSKSNFQFVKMYYNSICYFDQFYYLVT